VEAVLAGAAKNGAEIDRKSAKNDADLIEKAMALGEKL